MPGVMVFTLKYIREYNNLFVVEYSSSMTQVPLALCCFFSVTTPWHTDIR